MKFEFIACRVIVGLTAAFLLSANQSIKAAASGAVKNSDVPTFGDLFSRQMKLSFYIVESARILNRGARGWIMSKGTYYKEGPSEAIKFSRLSSGVETISRKNRSTHNFVPDSVKEEKISVYHARRAMQSTHKNNSVDNFVFVSQEPWDNALLFIEDRTELEGFLLKYEHTFEIEVSEVKIEVLLTQWLGKTTGFKYREQWRVGKDIIAMISTRIPRAASSQEIDEFKVGRDAVSGGINLSQHKDIESARKALKGANIVLEDIKYILRDLGYKL